MIRIVIADDHTIMREGLKRILDGAPDIEMVYAIRRKLFVMACRWENSTLSIKHAMGHFHQLP